MVGESGEHREERVLVCVGPGPGSARLIQAAARLARTIGCPWIAAHVALPAVPGEDDRNRLSEHLRLAESLGADAVRLTGLDAAEALARYAAERRVTRILIGKPEHARWRDRWSGGMVDRLIRGSGDIDVYVITGAAEHAAADRAPRTVAHHRWRAAIGAALVVLGVSFVAKLAAPVISDADVVMGYLLVVLVAAFRFGTAPALLASAASVAAYNFFFVPPFHTFAVADTRNLLTFTVLFGVGLAASALSDRLRRQEAEAVGREARTAALLSLTRALAAASDQEAVAQALVGEAVGRLARGAALFIERDNALIMVATGGDIAAPETVASVASAAHMSHGIVIRASIRAIPVVALDQGLGVLVLVHPAAAVDDLADAYAWQAGLALARARDAASALHADLRARTEQVRSALLSAVSHDLRTPLAAITLATTALLDGGDRVSAAERREILTSARDEAERLERLVANLLEMTRLTSGPVVVRREWVPLEEIVGTAFARVERLIAGRTATTDLGSDLPLLAVDPILVEVLLVNLIANAVQHTPPGTPIEIVARQLGASVTLTVVDHGDGLPPGHPERLFEPFVRGEPVRSTGSGLGLAICRGIARAHGGDVVATGVSGGGAAFVVTLPTGGTPPPVPYDEAGSPDQEVGS